MSATPFAVVLLIALLPTATLAGEVATQTTPAEVSNMPLANAPVSKASKAHVPGLMSYQGTLTDGESVAFDTTVSMAFTIYADSLGIIPVWTETQPAVVVSSGIFNVLLGSVNSIPDTVFKASERWLGVQVGSDPELTPRQQIVAVGYSFRAAKADTAEYAQVAVDDGDWTISGNHIYSAVPGSVGIGTTSPSAKLDVKGDVNADSIYKIGGSTVFSVSGIENTLVGIGAGGDNTGALSTFVGDSAGYKNQGNANTFLGAQAGYSNTTGDGNTFVGWLAGQNNETGFQNTFLGDQAGRENSGSYNAFLGTAAGQLNEGAGNTFLGWTAGAANTGGVLNTFIGSAAGHLNTTGGYNTFIGFSAGNSNTAGSRNVFIGFDAGYYETGSDKLYIANGPDTSDVLIYGDFSSGNIGMGTTVPTEKLDIKGNVNVDSLYKIGGNTVFSISGTENTLVGVGAGANNTGTYGTFVGYNAGLNNQREDNTFVGGSAGSSNTQGYSNTFLGRYAGNSNTTGWNNTFVGKSAGRFNTEGAFNAFLGAGAGNSNTTGAENTFVGYSAGNACSTGYHNTFIGSWGGYFNTTGYNNTFLGSYAGYSNTSGYENTYLGTEAGFSATGSGNVFIGHNAGWSALGSDQLIIANGSSVSDILIYGDFATGDVGIGTTSPAYRLDVDDATGTAAHFRTTQNSSSAYGCYGEAAPGAGTDARGVYGQCIPADYYGYGVYGEGGFIGVRGVCNQTGGPVRSYYGVSGYANLSSSDGTAYGVYGYGSGGSTHYGVYYAGGLGGSGTKSAIVRTEEGPKAVYCQESPENWFEDFGSSQIRDGRVYVPLASDFRQTVTINDKHPVKVFITPNTDIGRWWVEKGMTGFTLVAPEAPDGAQFDYRVVAKRKGYEDLRLESAPAAYADHFLYPDVSSVPLEHRDAWLKTASAERHPQ